MIQKRFFHVVLTQTFTLLCYGWGGETLVKFILIYSFCLFTIQYPSVTDIDFYTWIKLLLLQINNYDYIQFYWNTINWDKLLPITFSCGCSFIVVWWKRAWNRAVSETNEQQFRKRLILFSNAVFFSLRTSTARRLSYSWRIYWCREFASHWKHPQGTKQSLQNISAWQCCLYTETTFTTWNWMYTEAT